MSDFKKKIGALGDRASSFRVKGRIFQGLDRLRSNKMAAGVRQKVILACTECKQRNYDTKKNKMPFFETLYLTTLKQIKFLGRYQDHNIIGTFEIR